MPAAEHDHDTNPKAELSRQQDLKEQELRNIRAKVVYLGVQTEGDKLDDTDIQEAVRIYPQAKQLLLRAMANTAGVKFLYIPGPHNDRKVPCLVEIQNPLARPLDSVLGTTAFSYQQVENDEGPIYSISQWFILVQQEQTEPTQE